MRISVNWLKDYIDFNVSTSELIDRLNNIGLLVDEWEETEEDVILELETYANRPDTLGHLGVARELGAGLGAYLRPKEWPLIEADEKTSDLVDIQVSDETLCPRYCGIIIKGVKVGPSPSWLKKRVKAIGLRPVNNVVDVTNYVVFSTAHPVHAFDLAKISGEKIMVRRAKKGEVLKTLEEEDIALSPEMLVIADSQKPVALAGIIGGENSSITEETQDVFIESAYFDPVSIRKTRKKTGIQTDASYRFERGADISFPPQAALMTASLLSQMGGEAAQQVVDIYPKPRKNKTVVLRNHRISKLLGMDIRRDFIERILAKLGFHIENKSPESWQVKIPFFRVDIDREADLIEEVARFYGYDKVPSVFPPLKDVEPGFDQKRARINELRQSLFHYGFNEVLNFSFSAPEKEVKFHTGRAAIEIKNPISSKASLLRTNLMDGILENIIWNRNRGAGGVHVFEIGNIYFWKNEKYGEELRLALATTGMIEETHWAESPQETDFFHLKGTVEAFMSKLRYEPFIFKEENHPYFEPGFSLLLYYKGEMIGGLGLVRKDICKNYFLDEDVWGAELSLKSLFEKQPQPFRYTPVSRFPCVRRDISFLADKDIYFQEIKEALEKLNIPYLDRFELYDRYTGSSIPQDKASLSLRFIFCHPRRTLQAEEVDRFQQRIIHTLKTKFGFQLREGG
ncbi:phenylalanine--tRNA ligase subunit beta [bacterium]|nr:phenylalanine--tRNA ligase subunit beta [bacterium]